MKCAAPPIVLNVAPDDRRGDEPVGAADRGMARRADRHRDRHIDRRQQFRRQKIVIGAGPVEHVHRRRRHGIGAHALRARTRRCRRRHKNRSSFGSPRGRRRARRRNTRPSSRRMPGSARSHRAAGARRATALRTRSGWPAAHVFAGHQQSDDAAEGMADEMHLAAGPLDTVSSISASVAPRGRFRSGVRPP